MSGTYVRLVGARVSCCGRLVMPHTAGVAIRRTPTLLRFVLFRGDWNRLDALDQLDDEPRPHEWVVVAARDDRTKAAGIMCRRRRRGSAGCGCEIYRAVDYRALAEQPPPSDVATTAAWQAWALGWQRRTAPPTVGGGTQPEGEG